MASFWPGMPCHSRFHCVAPAGPVERRAPSWACRTRIALFGTSSRGALRTDRQALVEQTELTAFREISVSPEVDDDELMRRLAAGRQEALGPLYGRYASLI